MIKRKNPHHETARINISYGRTLISVKGIRYVLLRYIMMLYSTRVLRYFILIARTVQYFICTV